MSAPEPTRTYNHSTAASALFFKSGINLPWFRHRNWGVGPVRLVRHALRVEIPALGKEFTDNAYIGTDPEGLFYYDAASDLSGSVKAKVYKVKENKKTYVRIKFFTSDENQTYAEFIAEDPDDAVDATGMVDYTKNGRDGNWVDLDIGSANATVFKRAAETSIKLTAGPILKEATLPLDDASEVPGVDVRGTLYFKKISDLTSDEAKFASYNNDRIVFYGDDNSSKDFVAYFIPVEGSSERLGIRSKDTIVISDVTWAST